MNSWLSRLFAIFLALTMFYALATPANAAKSKRNRKHGKHVAAAHHAPKLHKPRKHA